MGQLRNIVTPLHTSTKRDYVGRMTVKKPGYMEIARQWGHDFWDGDRNHGYGGYSYDGRWKPVAETLIEAYGLGPNASILDIGCGKGYLLYELSQLLPGARVVGFDISEYAIENAKPEIKDRLFVHKAEETLPFEKDEFDLAISLTTLHNLEPAGLQSALGEMERVAKDGYLVVESYRNDTELFNLQCWALTCRSFFTPDGWAWFYEQSGYTGDWEYIYFE